MVIRRMRTLALDIFQILNNRNPNSMKVIFNFSPRSAHRKQRRNTSTYCDKTVELVDLIHGTLLTSKL